MDPAALFDFISVFGFGAAFLIALFIRKGKIDIISKMFLCICMGIYFAVSISNTLEHSGITEYLDRFEDYFEILFLPFFIFFIFTDYTWIELRKRNRAEQSLQKSEEVYRTLVENIDMGVSLIDRDYKIMMSNSAHARLAGKDVDDLLGCSCFREFSNKGDICPDCPGEKAMETGVAQEIEKEGRPGSGEKKIFIRIRAFPVFNKNNEALGFIEVVEDITERKKSLHDLEENESKFRSIFELSPQAVAVAEIESGILLDVNNKLCELTQYEKDELIGRSTLDIGMFSAGEREGFIELLRANNEIHGREMSFRNRDGSRLDVLMFAKIVKLHDEPVILSMFSDVTEHKKMEKELHKVQKLESIGILAGGIAHDFNNLLTGIVGNISLAKIYSAGDDKIIKKLAAMEKASMRAKDLTMQLLTFAKGGAPIKKTESLVKLLEDSCDFALSGSNVKSEISCDDDIWPILVDAGQIGQVFQNLSVNAKQAMSGGGVFTVRAENIEVKNDPAQTLSDGRYVRVSFADQGEGIPESIIGKIFDPYYTTKDEGSGLGLAVCYSIIVKHKGLITAESKAGEGSTFTIYLPSSEDDFDTIAVKESIPRGSGRILVVDDEDVVKEVVAEMLSQLGYKVELASDGQECLTLHLKAREAGQPYDVVIMDLTIPGGMGGKETIGKLLSENPEAKVIVSSGYSNDPVMANYKDLGFVGVISKPYQVEELAKILHEVV